MRNLKIAVSTIVLLLVFSVVSAADYDSFIGSYEGKYISPKGEKYNRDLSVEIEEVDDGFNITWKTVTFKKDKAKEKTYSIDFLETDREHIYEAAQKKNLFGGRDPLDPMKGEPYAWARIEGNKLTVFVLIVTDDGGYEMQTFDRILTSDNNLEVKFSRIRNGETFKAIETTLTRK
ncbi:MAG: hypothetical protein QNI91_06825 [Arenicellales bacterium]|nr:hypothetical protein [Arenicellales bacterium]